MFPDATTRFSNRVENYARYRPGYPRALVELLAREFHLTPQSVLADIGSGTGLLSRAFLDAGYQVVGVEPNRQMREAGDSLLSEYAGFRSVAGQAEDTRLAEHSVDFIVAGQAFHWFDPPRTKREWQRILVPGGGAALIWNEKLREGAFMCEVEALIDRFAEGHDKGGAIREGGRSRIESFFAPSASQTASFPNTQFLDEEGLLGRVFSTSYVPAEGDPEFYDLRVALEDIFRRHQTNNQVAFEYRTKVFWARL